MGLVPRWGWGTAMHFDVRPPGFPHFGIWVSEIASSTSSSATEPGALVSIRTAALVVCPSVLRAAISVDACAGMALGEASARGVGYEENLTEALLHWAVDAGVRLDVPIYKSVGLGLEVGAEAPLRRARFVGEGTPGRPSELFRADPVGMRIRLGLALRAE